MSDNPNYPVGTAALSWFDDNGQLHIRIYSTDGYEVTERCNDGQGWTTGGFKQAGGAVSATCWWQPNNGVHLRVYCTSDDVTTEWCNDPGSGWTKGSYTTT